MGEDSIKLIDLLIDSELTFNCYVQMICRKSFREAHSNFKTSKYYFREKEEGFIANILDPGLSKEVLCNHPCPLVVRLFLFRDRPSLFSNFRPRVYPRGP